MGPAPAPPERPFVGLRPFRTEESLLFFGRQRQVVALLERLHRTRFVGVVGSSGSGKSSLVLAGLIPALRAGFLVGDRDRWVVATMTPGERPWPRLAERLAGALLPIGFEGDADALRKAAETAGVSGLLEILTPLLAKANANLLLLADQFEEIFRRDPGTHASEQHEEDADFVSVLLDLARQREAPAFVVLTMRSDHLGECDDYLGLPEALNESQYLVPRLSRDEVREAIEGPIRLFGKGVAPRLVDRLLNDLGGQHDQLPVLQHALMRMWARLLESGQEEMDLAHYTDVGTLAQALSRHAEEALAGLDPARVHTTEAAERALAALDPAEVRAARIVFQALTDTDHANRQVRRWQGLSALQALTGRDHPADLSRLLERFWDDRRSFLRCSASPDGQEVHVDISHEALIRQWARLRGWVEQEAHHRDTYARLRDDAKRWEEKKGGLWEDPELAQARLWWDRARPSPAWAARYGGGFEAAKKFLEESEAKRDRDARKERERIALEARSAATQRKLRRTVVAAVVAGTLAVAAVYQWWRAEAALDLAGKAEVRARTEAKRAEAGERVARSLGVLRTDPEQSLRLAIEAVERDETDAAAGALREALSVSVVRKLWSVPLPRATAVAFAPDGRRLGAGTAAGREPGRAAIWDAGSGRLLSSRCGDSVVALRWTPDGTGLVLGLEDGSVVLWDPAARGPGAATTLVPASEVGPIEDLDVRPDGRELAVAAGPMGLVRFDLVLGPGAPSARRRAAAGALAPGPDDAESVAYSPDGRRLAVGWSKQVDTVRRGTVALVDTGTGETVCETRPGAEVARVAFSPPELGRVAATSFDHVLRSWPVADCRAEPTRHVGHHDLVEDLAFTGDGGYLVSAGHDSTIRLWDPRLSRDELFSRRAVSFDSGPTVLSRFSRLAIAPAAPPASPAPPPSSATVSPPAAPASAARLLFVTVGAEVPDEGEADETAEPEPAKTTLTLWDLAPRAAADDLRALTGAARPEDRARDADLLRLARGLRIEPGVLRDQAPECR